MNEIKVTLYITNYNYDKYIEKSILSVLNQSYQNFELIIIDDGSTDNSRVIIEKFSKNKKVEIIYQNNKGLNVSNNIALKIARGKYLMRLDADDFLDENALQIMLNQIEKDDNIGLVFPDYFLVDAEDNIINLVKRNSFKRDEQLLDMPAHGACTLIRTEYLRQLGGYDESFTCQDGYDLWLKFIKKYKVQNINTPLFYYRQHGNNLTQNEDRILDTRIKIKKKFQNQKINFGNVVCVIPVREMKAGVDSLALQKIGEKELLKWTIDAASSAGLISKIIITSPDKNIKNFVEKNYHKTDKIFFHYREEKLARLNISLNESIVDLFSENAKTTIPDILVTLTIRYPFIRPDAIDDAIRTLQIYSADTIVSVRPENDRFYQHHGAGMVSILNQDKFTLLEREQLYRHVGGITVTKFDFFKKNKVLFGGIVGHIIISQMQAHMVGSEYDFKIANLIAKNNM